MKVIWSERHSIIKTDIENEKREREEEEKEKQKEVKEVREGERKKGIKRKKTNMIKRSMDKGEK